jgi:hypothetical protein
MSDDAMSNNENTRESAMADLMVRTKQMLREAGE